MDSYWSLNRLENGENSKIKGPYYWPILDPKPQILHRVNFRTGATWQPRRNLQSMCRCMWGFPKIMGTCLRV